MSIRWLRPFWQYLHAPARVDEPTFAITCACGYVLSGVRLSKHQILPCPGCQRRIFVQPLPAFRPSGFGGPSRPTHRPSLRSFLWLFLPAVGLGLAAMLLLFVLIRWWLPTSEPVADQERARNELLQQIEQGRQHFDRGSIHLAREFFEKAIRQRDAASHLLSEAEHRQLNQFQRQAALLTDLAPVSLLAMLDQAEEAATPQAWQARFRADYLGRAVIFDDTLRMDREQRIHSDRLGHLRNGQTFGWVALEDLTLLRYLPLQSAQRWIFGARLKSIDREGGPSWIVRLEPESGVLFSEKAALEAELPNLRDDREWPLVLARQKALLEKLRAPQPYRGP